MVPNFVWILVWFSYNRSPCFLMASLSLVLISLLAFFTAGVSHGGGLTLHETYVKSVANLKASIIYRERSAALSTLS